MHRAMSGFVVLAFLVGSGCQHAAPTPTSKAAPGDAEQPAAAPTKPEDPRIEGIRARYQQIQADPGLMQSEFDLACKGGEGSGKVRLFENKGAIHKAELRVIPPGHGEDSYQFYYDQREVVFALYDMRNWAFTGGGTPEKPATQDSAIQTRYYYHDGDSIRCIKKKVAGPTDKIDSLLDQAPTAPDDCSKAGKVQKLASLARLGPRAKDELTELICP